MPDLNNSQRRLYKATYAPIQPDDTQPQRTPSRGVVKGAFVSALAIRPSEMDKLVRRLSDGHDPALTTALTAVGSLVGDASPASSLHAAQALAPIDAALLIRIGKALVEDRKAVAARVEQLVTDLRDGYRRAQATVPAAPTAPTPTAPRTIPTPTIPTPTAPTPTATGPVPAAASTAPAPGAPNPTATTVATRDALGRPATVTSTRVSQPGRTGGNPEGGTLIISGTVTQPAPTPQALAALPAGTMEDAIGWASQDRADTFAELHTLTAEHASVPLAYSNVETARAISYLVPKVSSAAAAAVAAVAAFTENMKIQPVGRLHLERIDMIPAGVERGELVSSIPLTPKETVNISHREWSVTTEEYESIIKDFFEGYSEQGVAEKNDVAQSTESEAQHASALNFGVSASASYMGVTISSSLGLSSSSSDKQAQKDSIQHSIASTRQASARVKKDHKVSFRTSSVAGTEDRAVRVITNPSDTMSMRVDYYQLMRKWRVDLYRYGLRMTYDIVIPSPGADLLRKIKDLAALDAQINVPFSFDLSPADIALDTWEKWAAHYQATVEKPPLKTQSFMASADIQKSDDDKDKFFVGAVEFEVDPDYTLTSGWVTVQYYYHDIGDSDFDLLMDVQFDATPQVTNTLFDKYAGSALQGGILGRSGHVSVGYFHRGVAVAKITILYGVTVRDEVFRDWQFRAWAAIRTAAEQRYQESRQQLKDQRAALATEIAPFDALTLRRMELEEVEKGVLRWLFGPSFNLAPADISAILNKMAQNDPYHNDALDPSSLSSQQWQRMMEFGEFIKYVQQAIEWENVLYFTYPYFWDLPRNWTLKQFLQHPDAIHRTFLRAGSARVVLTIRPGFEKSFSALIETGAFGKLPDSHPYVTIAQEIQDYANTNYPGIPPANPDGTTADQDTVDKAERGQLQARWWEYTPTSALDVQLNTSLPDMA